MRANAALVLQGLLLFLCIPLVLFLFLRQPLGPGCSVGVGLAVMLGHRFAAGPWMARHAGERCLWCGRAEVSARLAVTSGGRTWAMGACSGAHAGSVRRFLSFVDRFRRVIAAGIFVPLVALLAGSLASAAGRPLLPHDANALAFRMVVAATVVAASLAYLVVPGHPAGGAEGGGEPVRCPFPVHNLFLLGIGNTLWVFRLVGAWWLLDAAWRLWR